MLADDAGAQAQLSSLVRACANTGRLALCRYVSRSGAAPKLCVLAPDGLDRFTMVQVPFSSDVHRTTFPPLDRVPTRDGADAREHASIPTRPQQEAMDAFVDQMPAPGEPPAAQPNPGIFATKQYIKLCVAQLPLHAPKEDAKAPPEARAARSACFSHYQERGAKRAHNDHDTDIKPKREPPRALEM